MAISFSRPDPSSPASVGSATFTPSRRGYDQTEVREFLRMVAAELARLQERERFLESELKATQTNGMSTPGRLDEHTLIALLGEETARVLASAREASTQIRDRAEESATRMVKEASEDAARIRQAAEAEAQRLREDASGDAQGEIELAKQQGREMVEEARAYREKVLAELSRRRDAVRVQIEQMMHGRDRILALFERARSASDEVISEFVALDSDGEEQVATPSADHPSVLIFDHEREDSSPRPPRRPDTRNPDFERSLIIEDVARLIDVVPKVEEKIEVVEAVDTAATPVTTFDDSPQDVVDDQPHFFDVVVEESTVRPATPEQPTSHPSTQEPNEADDDYRAPVVSIFGGRRRPSVLEPAGDTHDLDAGVPDAQEVHVDAVYDEAVSVEEISVEEINVEAVRDEVTAETVADPEPTIDEPVRTSPGKQAIDDIFARLRASAPSTVADKANADQPETPRSQISITPVTPVVEPARFSHRDSSLAPLCEHISKKLKRVVADELNSILDHVNSKKPKLEVDAMVSGTDEHVARYVSAIGEEVLAAAAEGARSMKAAHGSVKRVDPQKVDESVRDMLNDTLVAPLRARLDQLLRDCDGNTDDIAEGVRAIYREWRMSRIDAHTADIACVAHSRGAFLSLKEGTEVCWMVDPNGPACADAEDNSLAGAVRCGEKFPTGHEHPLAHPGCRCLVCPKPH